MNSRYLLYDFALVFIIVVVGINCSEKSKLINPFPEKFAGVGMEIEKEVQYAKVVKVIPSSPADEAGIKVNDTLIAVLMSQS